MTNINQFFLHLWQLGKPHSNSRGGHLGIARKGGGGLNPYPDGLGHFFREEFAKIKWAFTWFWGGLNPCQDGLGHLCSENWSSIRYFLLLTRDLRLARILCGTYIPSKQWFDKVAQIGPEKSAPECPFECGGGVQLPFGQCPNRGDANLKGASLREGSIRKKTDVSLKSIKLNGPQWPWKLIKKRLLKWM